MKIGFFEAAPEEKSFMRLISFLVLPVHIMVDTYLFHWSYYSSHPYDIFFVSLATILNLIFLIAEFYPKYLQTILEMGFSKLKDAKPMSMDDFKVFAKVDNPAPVTNVNIGTTTTDGSNG